MTTLAEQWRGSGGMREQQREALSEALTLMRNAYQMGPWELPPDVLRGQLAEILREQDPWMVYNLLDQTAWEVIGGYAVDSSIERARAVNESKRLYKYNPLAQWSIWSWTNWGLGDKLRVGVPDNDEANEVVQEFFTAERNEPLLADDNVSELSNWLLVMGNRLFVFFTSTLDGETTIRLVDQSEITLIYNPDDSSEIWFYERTWTPRGGTSRTIFYPDWKTYFSDELNKRWETLQKLSTVPKSGAKLSWGDGEVELGAGGDTPRTDAYILFVPHNIKDESDLWGWPLLTNPRAWMQAHQHLMESRLTLAEAASMYVRRKRVTGGSRAVKSVISTIASNLSQSQWTDTNPPAVAGATEVENAQIETTDLPLVTGARDTAEDNRTFSWMALLGAGLFPTSAGLDTARWATALEMGKDQSMLFERYRNFWAAQFRKIAKIVVKAKEKFDKANYGEYTVDVSTDSFSLADFPAVAKTIGDLSRSVLVPLVADGTMPAETARRIAAVLWRVSLQALGIERAEQLTSDKAFGIAEEEGQKAVERLARIIGENVAGGDVALSNALEWVILEGVQTVVEQPGKTLQWISKSEEGTAT